MRHNRKRRPGCFILLLLILAAACFTPIWFGSSTSDQPVTITVVKGMSPRLVFRDLEKQGTIRSARVMSFYARLRSFNSIRPGRYTIEPRANPETLIADLKKWIGQAVQVPDGYWITRTGAYLEKDLDVCPAKDYVAAAQDASLAKDLGATDSLEGYLLPDTYDVTEANPAKELVGLQVKKFRTEVAPLLKGQDIKRVLTVASLLETEASDPSERRVIAGIIENRLKKHMRLEIDATVNYAINEWRVFQPGEVRTFDSPYNTYLHEGLPPGPICSPSISAIKAALNPTASDYLYYTSQGNGHHFFSRTYQEHQNNIRKSRLGQEQKP